MAALVLTGFSGGQATSGAEESLPPLTNGAAPQTFEEMWAGYDPRVEPLETEVLKEWEEDGVILRVMRYRIGIFKGQRAMMAAVYGYPKGGTKLPGLVQIHGGGQYADYRAPLYNAKRGYATISISWGGRISAPGYHVSPPITKLFWDGKTDDPGYKVTTDWGALDAYHAPNRNNGNSNWQDLKPATWTLDAVESPRNSNWFLCTLGARRALTFLEQQPEVNADQLGVYGHSMGGRITVTTAAIDPRVKAAAPSCGGVSKRDPKDSLDGRTISDDVSLRRISCPIMFLSPANDFHGRINDLQRARREITSTQWRLTCAAHHNHQDTAEYMVAGPLWFDQHLKGTFTFPTTPDSRLELKSPGGVPSFTLTPDASKEILAVDVYYTQQGVDGPGRDDMQNTVARFWHHAATKQTGKGWVASLPLLSTDKPLWVYANVVYPLAGPVTGAGYYYAPYTAKQFSLSSIMHIATPAQLREAGAKATRRPSPIIEDFADGWQKEWFTYDLSGNWARRTHKIYHDTCQAPPFAKLAFSVRAEKPNKMVVGVDGFAAEVTLNGNSEWQDLTLFPTDFQDATGQSFLDWAGIRELRIGPQETLRSGNGATRKTRQLGAAWQGEDPELRDLRWVAGTKEELNARRSVKLAKPTPAAPHAYLAPETADAISALLKIHADTDMHGKPLVVDGKPYEHGMTLHAPSEAIFFLGGKYAHFHAMAAAGPVGTVSFQVLLDGKKAYDGERLTRSESRVIDLPVAHVQEIRLIVTDGGNGRGGDWAHWIDAWVSE
ncbi:MAG: hypothetical protein HN849_05730 [Victivallales bacterium]|nr:hypothetical protein [Victivallales bacterium]